MLASVSASGLANSLFMPEGGMIVEIGAEVVVPLGIGGDGLVRTKQEIPTEFYKLGYGMGHTYVMVPGYSSGSGFGLTRKLREVLNLG